MLKRPHRKTKRGSKCAECRRRHIRCDLQKPRCVNCIHADRVCSFEAPASLYDSPTTTQGPFSELAPAPRIDSTEPAPSASSLSWPNDSLDSPQSSVELSKDGSLVNSTHLELFHYFTTMPSPYLGQGQEITDRQRQLVIQAAFATPYLMHQTLALAAKRRSIDFPSDKAGFYQEQATILQTRALSLFRSAKPEPDQQNCTAMFMFSGMLYIHMLADTLTLPGRDLPAFLDSFTDFLNTHRSVQSLTAGLWPMLMNSELRPILAWGTSQEVDFLEGPGSKGSSTLHDMISAAEDLTPEQQDSCYHALGPLLWALEDISDAMQRRQRQVQTVFTWPLRMPGLFSELLSKQRPEALVILACYGVVLRHARDVWVVGDSGAHLCADISEFLGPHWRPWLEKFDGTTTHTTVVPG